MDNPEILYRSTPQTDIAPASVGRRKFPLPQQSLVQLAAYAFDQEFECVLDGIFPPKPKNTPSNNATFGLADGNAILTAYTQPSPSGAGMGKFSAAFNIVPASWDDFKTMPFTFPGFIGALGSASARDVQSVKVTTRLHYDYFLVDPNGVAAGVKDSGGAAIAVVADASKIPRIAKTYFVNTAAGVPQFNIHTNSLVPNAGFTPYIVTFPSVETYLTWIAHATASGWDSDIWNGADLTQDNVGQIVADDSWLEPFAGNIWARITPYVLLI